MKRFRDDSTSVGRPSRWVVLLLILAPALGYASAVIGSRIPTAAAEPAGSSPTTLAGSNEATSRTASSGLDLRVEPFTDFYFLVRAQAAGVVPTDPELQPVIDAWMPVQEHIGTFGGFWRFDLPGMLSGSPEEFRSWFDDADVPESIPSRAGGAIPIKAPGLAMAAAMESVWRAFRETRWPEREGQLEDVRARLQREFMPKHREALGYMLRSLGIADPEIDVPTYLALDLHPPGATTYRTRTGPIFVASTRELLSEGRFSDLEETLLHEVCHALDIASEGSDDVFSQMRRVLEERGVTRSDPRHRAVPHLVMFVQAEETMRRLYDADHVAYGDTQRGDIAPLYERQGETAEVVRQVWGRYLDGDFDMHEAVRRILDEVVPVLDEVIPALR